MRSEIFCSLATLAHHKGNNIALNTIVPAPDMQQLNQVYISIIIKWEVEFFARSLRSLVKNEN